MPRLHHIKIEPCLLMKPFWRTWSARWMKSHQVVFINRFNSVCQGIPNFEICTSSLTVTAINSDNIRVICITGTNPFAINLGIFFIENYRINSPLLINFVAPGWQQSIENAFLLRFLITQSTCAKYFSFGFVGSLSIKGFSPSIFGVFSPSSSAKANAWITANPFSRRFSKYYSASFLSSRWNNSQPVSPK